MSPVQQIIPQVQALPMWVEYVKALGTPVVALVAASIAGVIAYRQWRTARNKLKLDLFDKRMAVYTNAVEVIKGIISPGFLDANRMMEVARACSPSPWLLSAQIADHLEKLVERGYMSIAPERLNTDGMTHEQKMDLTKRMIVESQVTMKRELQQLNSLFAPYLVIQH